MTDGNLFLCGSCRSFQAPTETEVARWRDISMHRYGKSTPCPGACWTCFLRDDDPRRTNVVTEETPACREFEPKKSAGVAGVQEVLF